MELMLLELDLVEVFAAASRPFMQLCSIMDRKFYNLRSTNGAGIGSGYTTGTGISTVGQLRVETGVFVLNASFGAGIGSGPSRNRGAIDSVRISGGGFVFSGSAGLDCRYCNFLILGNSSFDCSGILSISCIRAAIITFTSGTLIVRSPHSNFVEFESAIFAGLPDIWIEYLSTSVREKLIGLPIIHIEQLESLPLSIYKFYISPSDQTNPDCSRSFTIDSSQIRGIGFSVPSVGDYTISYRSLSTLDTGYLVHNSINTFSALFDNDNFYSGATLLSAGITCGPWPARSPTASPSKSPTASDEFSADVSRFSHI
jgi:hypothetical protein